MRVRVILLLILLVPTVAHSADSLQPPDARVMPLHGAVEFTALANVPGVVVHGAARRVLGSADIAAGAAGPVIRGVRVRVPVATLTTGMAVRDRHMRERVFRTADGEEPDVSFSAEGADCSLRATGTTRCRIDGELAIRGVARPATLEVEVVPEVGGRRLAATGTARVRLGDWGIAPPAQLGVVMKETVEVRFEVKGELP